ncbi:MAG: 1-acyl-sn-glycerol-3-phosphate acyltransferase [Oscillospiraceae bacterium]|nr:1-acyl-sn-glycerol-3-phosphate acyltransferase [Oscillospiraceae bacterium]
MKMYSDRVFRILRRLVYFFLRLLHPVVHVTGRENIPDGAVILAGNHSAISDPLWIICAARFPEVPRTMAKKELMDTPILGKLLRKFGVFPVDRGTTDVAAIKTAMKAIKDGHKLLIFPEGTRLRKGKQSEPHNGVMLLATRTQTQVLPIFVSTKKSLFKKIHVVFGAPYLPQTADRRATEQELNDLSEDLLEKIYRLGEGL